MSETICDFAAHPQADLIVIGARGLSTAKRILLGSVSQQVVLLAHCTALVWRAHSAQ